MSKRRKSKRKRRDPGRDPNRVRVLGEPPVSVDGVPRKTMERFMRAMRAAGYSDDVSIEWMFMRESDGRVVTRPRDQRIADIMLASLGVDSFDVDTDNFHLTNEGEALDWDALKAPQRKPGEHAVANYLLVCQKLLEGAYDPGATRDLENGLGESNEAAQLARRAWAASRNARVFEFDHTLRDTLLNEEAARLMNEVSRIEDEDEKRRWFDQQAARFPFPDPRPFEFCFFGFNEEIFLAQDYWHSRLALPSFDDVLRVGLLGYLIGPHNIWEMLYVWLGRGIAHQSIELSESGKRLAVVSDEFVVPNVVWDGEWRNPHSLNPFLVSALNHDVLTHQTVVKEHRPGLNHRYRYRKLRKQPNTKGFVPRPYYVVPIRDKFVEERERGDESGSGRQLSYRHDREGHWRLYVRRGPLPLAAKDHDKLLAREYKVYTGTSPDDPVILQDMMKKGHAPKKRSEWLAVKQRWIDDQVVGDASLPYIPAVRVPEEDLKKRGIG